MSGPPVVTATLDKSQYTQGDPVTVTFTVAPDTRTVTEPQVRRVHWTARDDEGNEVQAAADATVLIPVEVPDGLTITDVHWEDTGVAFTVKGLQATGTA